MEISLKQISDFQEKIWSFWKNNQRDLPWRKTQDPYKIFISELMLQQTQVDRVITKYKEFLEKFPNQESIINASDADIIRMWKGLGYNKRALYAKKAMVYLQKHFGGKFPGNEKDLKKLPGVGEYTARAILSFALHQKVTLIDTNIRQVIQNEFSKEKELPEHAVFLIAKKVLPKEKTWEWHQALMDYNALFLSKTKIKKKNSNKIPFKETNRFVRGKIIDLLRENSYSEINLIVSMKKFKKSKKDVIIAVESLMKDNLIVSKTHQYMLP